MPDDGWLPRTPLEGLIKIDSTLAGIVPRITTARERIADLLPGHSGRPAGTGDPGGGSGAAATTVVERTAMKDSAERRDLARIDELVDLINERAMTVSVRHVPGLAALVPAPTTHARQLVWVRWILRRLIEVHAQPSTRSVESLWRSVAELEQLVETWAGPRPGGKRSAQLAVDDTDTWCRSCLRAGHRNHRDKRYAGDGLCRWCGDFRAEQGVLPTLDIIDAHESGSPIRVAQLIKELRKSGGNNASRRRKRKRKR